MVKLMISVKSLAGLTGLGAYKLRKVDKQRHRQLPSRFVEKKNVKKIYPRNASLVTALHRAA